MTWSEPGEGETRVEYLDDDGRPTEEEARDRMWAGPLGAGKGATMATITITKTVKFHGDVVRSGSVFEAEATEGGWLIAHPRVAGGYRMIPSTHAEAVATQTVWQHRDGLVTFAGALV